MARKKPNYTQGYLKGSVFAGSFTYPDKKDRPVDVWLYGDKLGFDKALVDLFDKDFDSSRTGAMLSDLILWKFSPEDFDPALRDTAIRVLRLPRIKRYLEKIERERKKPSKKLRQVFIRHLKYSKKRYEDAKDGLDEKEIAESKKGLLGVMWRSRATRYDLDLTEFGIH